MAFTKEHTPPLLLKGLPAGLPAQVQVIRNRFENWRKSKQGRQRIPEPLWAAAVKLCETHRLHRVARWLRLNHTALRDRIKKIGVAGSRRDPAFVEWLPAAAPRLAAAAAEYLLEVERAGERTLRVRMRGVGATEVAALACALRRDTQQG